MKLKQYLSEKYFDSLTRYGHTIDIFVNPTMKELRDMYKDKENMSIGFICDLTNDKIYFFSRQHIIHQDAFDKINTRGKRLYKDPTILTGEMEMMGGKVMNINFRSYGEFSHSSVITDMRQQDWSFFDKWVPNIQSKIDHYFRNWR